MDFLQVALILLIVVLGVFLSILGIQVFFILKDLRRSLNKLDEVLNDAQNIADDLEKPSRAIGEVTEVLESGVRIVKAMGVKTNKSARRLFKRR
ncbi:hypothetical protein A3H85_00965 [Candidatus Daviesbacteria bacterium RIFCSPLOWO2_02_FULL_40_8]|uniref:DUF948 domain-containing protein n=1 Tax=Candidatus Daviesbacteria bacterium RIFCSPLOWO2_01_FULL_40_24 TaxID=1797787 RepID=A0A1F5MKS0_9BACT|nr:MAG: hypothetical protein A2780_00625 [Candidatus Daviesbacteria bacterium RIFCSPHIGHO2_01_FULL_41_45]OGE34343.1 MAG: hypothetical protein A3C32_01990 [Candidatus Daviesbacteria bacterium RIFCSPHIGHO2_02_FULL_41_14]OGE65890.1 MAG: hypothetical protein A3B49_00260 [Candidatus Daviesbacteria bacterium RIFCSPLOWO2_01_FULL_40_24]OGE67035.1 MAG: hypothetical protein A3H85_00965 [Candidatus Daviesbacteria bacterium RIFCSPLOWO2_02_FULL_40_8]